MIIRNWVFAALLVMFSAVQGGAQMAMDLRDVNLRDYIQIVAEATGRNFILDPRVQGVVTVIAPKEVSPTAAYKIFLNVLELNRLTIVEGDEADRIVPIGLARELSPGISPTGVAGAYETRVIEIYNVPPADIVEVIKPLLAAEAVLSVVPDAGLIILSDRQESFHRIVKLVNRLDLPRQRSIETIRLSNGNATDMLQVVRALDIVPAGASLSADARANALVVSGNQEFRDRVRAVVLELDTPQRSIATEIVNLNYADAKQLEAVVRGAFASESGAEGASGGITIVAETQRNSLIVTAPSDRVGAIVSTIRELDHRPSQVLIEAVIFEIAIEDFADLSVQFGALLNDAIVGGVEFSLQGRSGLTGLVSSILTGKAASAGSGGTLGGLTRSGGNGFAGFITALSSKTSTRLLSTPSILTLNNQEAEIVVAQNVPFVTGSFSTVGDSAVPNQPFQTIQRQDVGLTLRVKPQITRDNTVRLAVLQEVSNLTNSASAAGGEITAKRRLSTNVLVHDGRVIILGGLLEDGSGSVGQRVPGLSNIPIIGGLFRGRNASKKQRVLLMMLRPRILRNDGDATRVTRQAAREAKQAARLIQPLDDGRFPAVSGGGLPFDGVNLNQPFDAGFIDSVARQRRFPPLPSRLEFQGQ